MIYDAHFHIIDHNYPLIENQGYLPQPFLFDNYQAAVNAYKMFGGTIVSGSFQGFDQGYLIDLLSRLDSNYVGVVNLKYDATDDEILWLYEQRIRGIRINLFRYGNELITGLLDFANRIYALCGMHVELYISGEQINQYYKILAKLPKYSVDYLGLTKNGLPRLYKLVRSGAYIKACGFMRVDFDIKKTLLRFYRENPSSLMFGTDLPGTRADRPFDNSDLQIILDSFDENAQHRILYKNARSFYKLSKSTKA